jgi:hypothetical protein
VKIWKELIFGGGAKPRRQKSIKERQEKVILKVYQFAFAGIPVKAHSIGTSFFCRPYRAGFVTHVVVQALMNFQILLRYIFGFLLILQARHPERSGTKRSAVERSRRVTGCVG